MTEATVGEPAAEPRWAVVEIMGHRQRAGAISDAIVAGKTFLRIEHPTLADHTSAAPLTEFYSAESIFAIRPCSMEEVKAAALYWRSTPSSPPALSAEYESLVDEPDDDDDYNDEPM